MRVVQISDTHLSRWDGPLRRNFRAVADFVNTVLKPDLIVNTGDLILSNPGADEDYAAAKQLHLLLAAPVRFVPGNHDVGEAYDHEPRQMVPVQAGDVNVDQAGQAVSAVIEIVLEQDRVPAGGTGPGGVRPPLAEPVRVRHLAEPVVCSPSGVEAGRQVFLA
jgi:predicted MPP superfamily phosphohydrolase